MSILWQWIIGGGLLLFYAQRRFNDPPTNRSSTTFVRYYSAFTAYLLSLGMLFALLGGGITSGPEILAFFTHGGSPLNDAKDLPGPLLAALVLTVLLPNFPLLSQLDQSVKAFFQEVGSIPSEARHLSGLMRRSTFTVPPAQHDDIRADLTGFPDETFVFSNEDSLRYKWISVVSLYLQVMAWPETKRFSRFTELNTADYTSIKECMQKLRPRVLDCFALMQKVPGSSEELFGEAVAQCKKVTSDHVDDLFKLLCNFIARAILDSAKTQRERDRQLAQLGFSDMGVKIDPLDVNQIVTISSMVFVIMLVGMLVLGKSVDQTQRIVFVSAMVSIIYGAAVVAAIYPKTRWKFANRRVTRRRPSLSYLLTGAIAFVFAFVISLTFKFVYYGDFIAGLRDIRWTYPWLYLAVTLAVLVAYFIDDYVTSDKSEPKWLPWREGVFGSLVMSLAAWLVYRLLIEMPGLPEEFRQRIPPEQGVIVIAATIGFVICFFAPHWFRRKSHENIGGDDRATRRDSRLPYAAKNR